MGSVMAGVPTTAPGVGAHVVVSWMEQLAAGVRTMVAALLPAVDALRDGLAGGAALPEAAARAAAVAATAARGTIPLQARKGRASYLGERSVGHEDPGAASTVLVMTALARAV